MTSPLSIPMEFSCDSIEKQFFNVLTLEDYEYTYPINSSGTCKLEVVPTYSYLFETKSVNINFMEGFGLDIVSPDQSTSITYGQAVTFLVNTNDPAGIKYTATFSCTTGSYQITGLNAGVTYKLALSGIYGNIVVTVTATNHRPTTSFFTIKMPSANIPPGFIPSRSLFNQFVFANMKDDNIIEIIGI